MLIIVVIAIVIALLFKFSPKPEKKAVDQESILVATQKVTPRTLQPTLTLFGRVESPHATTLSASTSAFVEAVMAYEGQAVKQGELLVSLDRTDAELMLAQREADLMDSNAQIAQQQTRHQSNLTALRLEKELLALADKAAARYENLLKKNLASDTQRDESLQSAKRQALSVNTRELSVQDHPSQMQRLKAQQTRAQALRDQAMLDLQRTQITAPFNGRVTQVMVSPSNRVRQGDPVISLFDTDKIEVRAQIPARYLDNVRTAINNQQNLTAYILLEEQQIPMALVRLAGNVSESKGGIDAFFRFEKPELFVEIGRAVELHLQLAPIANSVALPPTALYGQSRIYTVTDEQQLRAIPVKPVGEMRQANGEAWILVRGDIAPGTPILTTQLPNAISGLSVSVQNNELSNESR